MGSPLSRRQAVLPTPVGRRAEQVKKSHPLAVRGAVATRGKPMQHPTGPLCVSGPWMRADARDRCCKCSRRARRIRNGHPTPRSSCFSSRRQRQIPSRARNARARTSMRPRLYDCLMVAQMTLKTESPHGLLSDTGLRRDDPPWRCSRYAWPGLIILVDYDAVSAYLLREVSPEP